MINKLKKICRYNRAHLDCYILKSFSSNEMKSALFIQLAHVSLAYSHNSPEKPDNPSESPKRL